jgi:hypothetical protein
MYLRHSPCYIGYVACYPVVGRSYTENISIKTASIPGLRREKSIATQLMKKSWVTVPNSPLTVITNNYKYPTIT